MMLHWIDNKSYIYIDDSYITNNPFINNMNGFVPNCNSNSNVNLIDNTNLNQVLKEFYSAPDELMFFHPNMTNN